MTARWFDGGSDYRILFAPPAEAFLLFSQSIPSHNELGIIDPRASTLELSVNGRDLTVTQSPSVLSSNRAGGTTGAGTFYPHPPEARPLSFRATC